MCGICALWLRSGHPQGSDAMTSAVDKAARAMISSLHHRGPDDNGLHFYDDVRVIGHTRLSIVDVAHGHQPFVGTQDNGKEASLVVNGELYNHKEIEHKYQLACSTESDCECILRLWMQSQQTDVGSSIGDHLSEIEGMYAFLLDTGDGRLVAGRDPLGIKPLYYTTCKIDGIEMVCVSSEVKAFEACFSALNDVGGSFGRFEEFPPGSWTEDFLTFHSFWSLPTSLTISPLRDPVVEQVGRVRKLLEDAVTKRLMADVPVGAFLSGGIDSSVVAAIASKQYKKGDFHTFVCGTPLSVDLQYAQMVADQIGSTHHVVSLTLENIRESLPQIILAAETFEKDIIRTSIPGYICSKEAAKWVKTCLTGEGADEVFAGYPTFRFAGKDPQKLFAMQHQSTSVLHATNLQRVDRTTMAVSLEARVPFLDIKLVEFLFDLDGRLKLFPEGDDRKESVEKWILRAAMKDIVPEAVLWRKKEPFDESSGLVSMIDAIIEEELSKFDVEKFMAKHARWKLRSPDEAVFFRILQQQFPNLFESVCHLAWPAHEYFISTRDKSRAAGWEKQ